MMRLPAAARLWLLAVVLPCVLVACAVRPPEPTPELPAEVLYEQRISRLTAYNHWRTSGRAAFNTEQDNASMSMQWRQTENHWVLDLRGPLGSGSVRLEGNAAGVVLRGSDGTVEEADDGQELLYRYTGYAIPVDVLRDWLRGMPSPEYDVELEMDEYGRPTELEQLGWHIRYTAWSSINGTYMPARISMEGPGIDVRASLREWELGRD
ncbi:MAG: lipoprotein insertase outer membrane protein LolB [Aquisalimonadaceae bacterium]